MRHTKLAGRRYLLVFETGDEAMETLREFAAAQGWQSATFAGIGAASSGVAGSFDPAKKEYAFFDIAEQVEILSFVGDVTRMDGEEAHVHAHATLARPDGSTLGGHLQELVIRPTLELHVHTSATPVARRMNDEQGLALIDLTG